jgi:hypothetical protein
MNGFFSDGIDGVEDEYSSRVPTPLLLKNDRYCNWLLKNRIDRNRCHRHSKLAVAHLLCAAQRLSIDAQKST